MDLAKFLSLLVRRELFFPSAARLGDPFEGSYPAANIRLRPEWYGEHAAEIDRQAHGEKLRRLESTLISCWHMGLVESAAMWQLYSQRGYGIAVVSNYDRLRDGIIRDQPFYIGKVRYLRYDTDPMPEGNLFDAFVHKRASFAHEQELRIVTERYVPPGTTQAWLLADGPPPYCGDYLPVALDTLVEAVVVGPKTPGWVRESVEAAARRFELGVEVRPSELDASPQY
jgi:hypothetical protein